MERQVGNGYSQLDVRITTIAMEEERGRLAKE